MEKKQSWRERETESINEPETTSKAARREILTAHGHSSADPAQSRSCGAEALSLEPRQGRARTRAWPLQKTLSDIVNEAVRCSEPLAKIADKEACSESRA